jgi:16S rRNA G527 N7-methylase RsmG
VRVLNNRSENQPSELFASAVSRATFSTTEDMEKCLRWLLPGGKMYLYRTEPTGFTNRITEQHRYTINANNRLVEIWTHS